MAPCHDIYTMETITWLPTVFLWANHLWLAYIRPARGGKGKGSRWPFLELLLVGLSSRIFSKLENYAFLFPVFDFVNILRSMDVTYDNAVNCTELSSRWKVPTHDRVSVEHASLSISPITFAFRVSDSSEQDFLWYNRAPVTIRLWLHYRRRYFFFLQFLILSLIRCLQVGLLVLWWQIDSLRYLNLRCYS